MYVAQHTCAMRIEIHLIHVMTMPRIARVTDSNDNYREVLCMCARLRVSNLIPEINVYIPAAFSVHVLLYKYDVDPQDKVNKIIPTTIRRGNKTVYLSNC
jgi:hypothetical protein